MASWSNEHVENSQKLWFRRKPSSNYELPPQYSLAHRFSLTSLSGKKPNIAVCFTATANLWIAGQCHTLNDTCRCRPSSPLRSCLFHRPLNFGDLCSQPQHSANHCSKNRRLWGRALHLGMSYPWRICPDKKIHPSEIRAQLISSWAVVQIWVPRFCTSKFF